MPRKSPVVVPGKILLQEYMVPRSVSQNKLARDIDVPLARVNDLVHGRRSVTANTALRLGAYFGTTPEFWLNLQLRYDLKCARRKGWRIILKRIRPLGRIARPVFSD